jgi:hypothetical protein
VAVGEPHVVLGWVLDDDGDTRVDGAALVGADGAVRAVARARWVARRQPPRA